MKRLVPYLAVPVAAVLMAFLGLAGPADAASLPPILYASQGGFAHQCTVIGNDGTVEGVVCADIVTGLDPEGVQGQYWAEAQVEAYCQNIQDGIIVQCANATVDFGLFGPGTSWPLNAHTYAQCGHGAGPCAGLYQRNYFHAPSMGYSEDINHCSGNVGLETQVQTVDFSENFNTSIELPVSDKTVYLTPLNGNDSPNQASGHYFICP
ncbi:hypothetical protein ACIGXM_31745 [Kitasatospora sp. NPDC052896]|uniref:hypothetical protein n=1 Tax=Kitasatospora sp. NPDC052896 TaxID=3364061 RepID=UPI0037C8C904